MIYQRYEAGNKRVLYFCDCRKNKECKKIPATPREPQSAFLQVKVSIEQQESLGFS